MTVDLPSKGNSSAGAQRLLEEQSRLLECIALHKPVRECIELLTDAIARLAPGVKSAVLVASPDKATMDIGFSSQLPAAFATALQGKPISDEPIGTCGTAIHTGKPVSCADIAASGFWSAEWKSLCLAHEIKACHSQPILGFDGTTIASLFLCFDAPRPPGQWELRIAAFGAHVAGIALERERLLEEQRFGESHAALLQEVSTRLVAETDTATIYQQIIDAACVLMRSEFASMQACEPGESGLQLRLLASRGFSQSATRFWQLVTIEGKSTCGVALQTHERVVVPDVRECEFMSGSDDLATYEALGIAAVQSTPLVSRAGSVVGMVSTHWARPHEPTERELRSLDILARLCADIIERNAAQTRERKGEERFRAFVTASSDIVYAMSADWSTMQSLEGKAFVADTLQPSTAWLDKYIHPDDQQAVNAAIAHALREKQMFDLVHRVRRADDSLAWVSSRAVPIVGPDGEITEWFGAARDITEQAELEARLRDSDRRKDEFLAILAHELRNPLAPVRMAVEILRRSDDEARVRAAKDMIDRQVGTMARLIDDLMDVGRVSRGKLDLRLEDTDLRVAIEAAADSVRPQLKSSGQELSLKIPQAALSVYGDSIRLTQVFVNLLHNASKFSPAGSIVDFEVATTGSEAVVRVRDQGAGIQEDMLDKVWEMFVQLSDATGKSQAGLGIGLTLVKSLIDLHGGTVKVESEGLGRGSTFTVKLPLSTTPVQRGDPLPTQSARTAIGPLRILVADDNVDAADSLGMLLQMSGCEVDTAYDGATALAAVSRSRPRVAFLDLGMPKLGGIEVAKRMRAEAGDTPLTLVAITGWGQEQDRRRTLAAGFDHHLVKPVSLEAVTAILNGLHEQTIQPG